MREKQQNPVRSAWLRRGILIVLVLAAAALWWLEGRPASEPGVQPTLAPAPTVHGDERLKRENAYDRDVAALQALVESGAADESTREMAAQKLASLIAEHQNEIGLETALVEAGYPSAVVIVQNGAVTVMIPSELLNETSSAQILSLCIAHTDVGAENVRVMAIN